MIELKKNHSLTSLNTFKLTSHCEFFFEINNLADLRQFVCKSEFRHLKKRILGGGSNIILSENIKGIVLKNNLKKLFVDSLNETNDDYFLNIGSGENWNDFISWTLNHKIYGLENLSLIPGTVGAAPIQNIGAYGSEVKNFIDQVKGVHLNSGIEKTLNNHECQFSYRYSVFKDASYDDFFITDVIFKIPKKNHLEFSYGELKDSFQSVPPTPELISEKVKEIRAKKLPNLKNSLTLEAFLKIL
jgi:UDP-N-acetylmuramate dehydrogenase